MAKEPKPKLDVHTARVVRELRSLIEEIEAGSVVLRRASDNLIEDAGLHRELSFRVTVVPPKV